MAKTTIFYYNFTARCFLIDCIYIIYIIFLVHNKAFAFTALKYKIIYFCNYIYKSNQIIHFQAFYAFICNLEKTKKVKGQFYVFIQKKLCKLGKKEIYGVNIQMFSLDHQNLCSDRFAPSSFYIQKSFQQAPEFKGISTFSFDSQI